jgi:hypothetical protein
VRNTRILNLVARAARRRQVRLIAPVLIACVAAWIVALSGVADAQGVLGYEEVSNT